MRILLLHNHYKIFTGEEAVVESIRKLVENHGHDIIPFYQSSEDIPKMKFGELRAFCSGIYSFSSKREVRRVLSNHKPDIVHIHNLFPFISPSVLGECTKAGIPIIMTVHNYRLFCPVGLNMFNGEICERCDKGEHWCVLRNCTGSFPKSVGYAVRNYVARKARLYYRNVTIYVALTEFQQKRLIAKGLSADRIVVIPNIVEIKAAPENNLCGAYVGFVGRISPEKGIETLLAAAKNCPSIAFKAAGDYHAMPHIVSRTPANFEFLGMLKPDEVGKFYAKSRFIVLPSICYEGFGLVLLEAMICGRAVICSRIGGLPEIVDDGVTGLMFEPGNAEDLAEKVRYLWDRPELCRKMGQAGREKALREYSPEKYYECLMAAYEKAIELGPRGQ